MKERMWLVLALAVAGSMLLCPAKGWAQSGITDQHGRKVTCASDDGKWHLCRVDTSRGVQMVKQRSGSPCIQGQTWGYDTTGIWVDRGCRADFRLRGGNTGGGNGGGWGGGNQGGTLTCESNIGLRKFCPANTSGGVQLIQQLSGSPCTQGQTWGFDNLSVWVDKGCRATFQLGSGGGPGGPAPGGPSTGTLTCESNIGLRKFCPANTSGGVQLIQQLSGSPCLQGQTWGYDNLSVWVDKGCRATFQLGSSSNNQVGAIVTCSSDDGRRHYCQANTSRGVRLRNQRSGSPCIQGQTWGYDSGQIWVDRGCRAEFDTSGR